MKFTSTQTNFNAGRLSPKLFGRIDTNQYRNGASILERMQPTPGGIVERMWGTRYYWLTANTEIETESRTHSFTLGENTVTVHLIRSLDFGTRNRIRMLSYVYPYAAGAGSIFNGIILPEGDFETPVDQFDFAVIDRTLVMTHYSGKIMPFYFQYTANGTLNNSGIFVQGQGGRFGDPSPNVTQYNIANPGSPYTYAGLGLVGAPMSDIGEVAGEVTIGNPLGTFGTDRTLDITSTTPAIATILQRSIEIYLEALGKNTFGGANSQSVIVSDSYFVLSTVTNGVRVRVDYGYGAAPADVFAFGGVTKTDRWAFSLWYAGNWPRTVTTYEGRLVFGGTPDKPLTLFGSKVNGYRQFRQFRFPYPGNDLLGIRPPTGNIEATDPYVFGISSKDDSRITFLQPAQALVIGTDRKEYAASGGDTILSALSVNIKPYTAHGSSSVSSVNAGSNVFFISNSGRQLFMFRFNGRNGTFVSSEVSLLFSDLIEGDLIKSLCWAAHRNTLFVIMQSQKIYGIVVNDSEDQQNLAFFDPKITGEWMSYAPVFNEPVNNVFYNMGDHCVVPKITSDNIGYMIVTQEQVESDLEKSFVQVAQSEQNTHLYIDYAMNMLFSGNTSPTVKSSHRINNREIFFFALDIVPIHPIYTTERDPAYADSDLYIIKIAVAGNYVDHVVYKLTPAEVAALPTETDSGPALSTGNNFSLFSDFSQQIGDIYVIGLAPPAAKVATMPVEAGQQWGSAQMGIKNIDTLGIRFYKTYSYEISSDNTNWQEVVVASNVGECTTGRKETKRSSSPDYDNIVYIKNEKPEPMSLLGISMRGISNDG